MTTWPSIFEGKDQKASSIRASRARAHQQDKTKRTRENNSKKAEELKPSSHRIKIQEKPIVLKTKRKRNPHELSHDSFKKPHSDLSMHMLGSVKVFHLLGKQSEEKTGISSSSSWALQDFSNNKDPRPGLAATLLLGMSVTLDKAQRPESNAHKE